MVNIFAGGPVIQESFNESPEKPKDPLQDLDGKKIEPDGAGLYNTKNRERKNVIEAIEKQSQNRNVENAIEFSLVERYLKEKGIDANLQLDDDGKIDIDVIEGLSIEEKTTLKGLIDNLLNTDNREINKKEFFNDIKKIEAFSEISESIEKNQIESLDYDIGNLIGANYIKINMGNNGIDIEKDLSTAIKTTGNEIIKEFKNIKIDSISYKNSIKHIKSGNLTRQIEGIRTLFLLASAGAGFSAAKTETQRKAIQNKLKPEIEKKKQRLEKEIKLTQDNLEQENNIIEKQRLKDELQSLKEEQQEIVSGEVYTGGEMESEINAIEKK